MRKGFSVDAAKVLLILCIAEFVALIAMAVVYNLHVHKLLNKLMSRDYRDYHTTVAPPQAPKRDAVSMPDIPEDLRVLQGFQLP